ncbi:MAG: pyridoxamine 5'-phosphate oxidase family protein [Clostridiales bacterium]|jgi:nitroimidazol reductase NimA-like FMN-containing flavoprotein (pyridoxamine 5'-phosphate oxidase superfamily)|nr:pyridoxamine 5'-phosphate oxidase family protein [Clostridiales bacterium]
MEYPTRRAERALSRGQAEQILQKGEYGFLALRAPDGAAYGVPLNYVFSDRKIYLHGATQGKKIDCVNFDDRVSFTVVAHSRYVEGKFTTNYECAMAFGRARVSRDDEERRTALKTLCAKYSDEDPDGFIEKAFNRTAVIVIDVESVSGKANPAT